jgi:hypothetical protein
MKRRSRRAPVLPLLLPLLPGSAGCVRLIYAVDHIEEPVAKAAIAKLQPGADDLRRCLDAVGSPHFVWEYAGNGMAHGWVYSDAAGWSVDLSWSFERFVSASFSLDLDATDLPGAVLWFDSELRLLEVREGSMRSLTAGLRRPAPVDDG